jgi:hypothetical protein
MPESGPYGSMRGALSNERPYRDPAITRHSGTLSEPVSKNLHKSGQPRTAVNDPKQRRADLMLSDAGR